MQTCSFGRGLVKKIRYFDTFDTKNCSENKPCNFDFYNIIISDTHFGNALAMETKALPLFDIPTNTTVYMSLQVGDTDGSIRDIKNFVIPFNEITEEKTKWTPKIFYFPDSNAYLKILFKIKYCYDNFRGLGCNFCSENYYTINCDKYCLPVTGDYSCDTSGDKTCAEHKSGDNCDECKEEWSGEECEECAEQRTGTNCEDCMEGWGGNKCQECADGYYPEGDCTVKCSAVQNKFTCKADGTKLCSQNWRGEECEECAENYFPEKVCNVECFTVGGKYTCSDEGGKVCTDNWEGIECNICIEGWGGNECQQCVDGYYPEGDCTVKCSAVQNKFTCKADGTKLCSQYRKGEECDECAENYFPEKVCNVECFAVGGRYTCSNEGGKVCNEYRKGMECDVCFEGYFGGNCDVFCKETEHNNCSLSGEKVCLDNTTTVKNNCQKPSKLIEIVIGAAVGTTLLAVSLTVGSIIIRKNSKTSYTTQLVETTDTKHAQTAESGKSVHLSTILDTSSNEMTYANLNLKDGCNEADATYATLNLEHDHLIEDKSEQSNYYHLVKPTNQTHIKKGKENVNQEVPRTEDLQEEGIYADIFINAKSCGPSFEKSYEKFEKIGCGEPDASYSSLVHELDPSAEDDESAYSNLHKIGRSIKDRGSEELEEDKTHADITRYNAKSCGSSVEKSDEKFVKNGCGEADATYSSLVHELDPSAEDDECAYSHLNKFERSIKDRGSEELEEDKTNADITRYNAKSCDSSVEKSDEKFAKNACGEADATYSSLVHELDPSAENDECAYSHLNKFERSIKDRCSEELEEDKTNADITRYNAKSCGSSVEKSDKKFAKNGCGEADATYSSLVHEPDPSAEDDESTYSNLHRIGGSIKDRGSEELEEDKTHADITRYNGKSCGSSVEKSDEKFAKNGCGEADATYSSFVHELDPSAEDDECAYSHLNKFERLIKDRCSEELEEDETYADITILGPKDREAPDEAAEDNEEGCIYAEVTFVGERMQENIEALTNIQQSSAIYFTMRDTREEIAEQNLKL